MVNHRLRRVTADIDSKNIINLLYRLYRAIKLNPTWIDLRPSTSKGYHLTVWTRAYGNMEDLRKSLGDDEKRIRLDRKRKIGKQTLFDKKTKINKNHWINKR